MHRAAKRGYARKTKRSFHDGKNPDRIKSIIDGADVVLFMKGVPAAPQCGFSAAVVKVLNGVGVKYEAVNVLADPLIREGIKEYSNWPTIPAALREGRIHRRLRHRARNGGAPANCPRCFADKRRKGGGMTEAAPQPSPTCRSSTSGTSSPASPSARRGIRAAPAANRARSRCGIACRAGSKPSAWRLGFTPPAAIGFCRAGPLMVIYPEGVWYAPKTPEDIDEIVETHLKGGELVERLVVVLQR